MRSLNHIQILLHTVFVLIFLSSKSPSEACGLSANTYCLNERQFISCGPLTPGAPVEIFTCPTSEQFCADVKGTCTKDTSLPRSRNTYCGKCSENTGVGHTCTGLDTYRICNDGEAQSGGSIKTCPRGQYCNAFSSNYESPCSYFSGREVLCWEEEDIPGMVESTSVPSVTTEPPPFVSEDETKCAELGAGRHQVEGDSTCQTFLICEKKISDNNSWLASRSKCHGDTVFAPHFSLCVPPAIYRCPFTDELTKPFHIADVSSRVRQTIFF